jgi:hypothetical protein
MKSAGARRILHAQEKRERWADVGGTSITSLVATAWPEHLIQPLIDFMESPRMQARYTHDDPVATLFVKKNKLSVWATVPSLVQHPDVAPSLIDKPHGAGKYRNRVAFAFIDE